jgi:hypothetical protein
MKRILVNWYYDRPDLTQHLLNLSDEAHIIFLAKHLREKSEENKFAGKNVSIAYWSEYNSPYQLLNILQPDLIVFHDIEAFNQIALNIAARNKKITTYVLQHGIRGSYEISDALAHRSETVNISVSNTSRWTLKFLFRSLRLRNFNQIFPLLKFIVQRKRNELTVALYNNKFELRRADYYIEFSKANMGYHNVRDGIPGERFLLVGNPTFDPFFTEMTEIAQSPSSVHYALLIDTPFCEAVFMQKERMKPDEKNRYILELEKYCRHKGLVLYVKLHPLTYQSTSLPQSPFINYFRESNLAELIGKAEFVFLLHFSSLAPLVFYYKPFFFFKNKYVSNWELNSVIGAQDLSEFKAEDLAKEQPHAPLPFETLKDYLFIPDGKAGNRLKEILLHSHR